MAEVSAYLDKRYSKKNGSYPLKLIIYHNNVNIRFRFNKNVSLTEDDWVKINSPKLKDKALLETKNYIEAEKSRAAKVIKTLGDDFTFEAFDILFNNKIVPKKTNEKRLWELFIEKIKELKDDERLGTAVSYECSMQSLMKFSADLAIKDVTPKFLERYEKWMVSNGNSLTTVGIYLRNLRAILNIAKDAKLINEDEYPFGLKKNKYVIPKGSKINKATDIDNLKLLKNVECQSEEAQFAKDMWFFSLYCNGMNMADIFDLKYKDIHDDFLYFKRKKTQRTQKNQKPVEVSILDEVSDIIERWGNKDHSPGNYIFKVYTHSMTALERFTKKKNTVRSINGYMKRFGEKLGINIKISTYVARHSWATNLKNTGTSIEEISEGLGHTSVLTTKNYLDSFPKEHIRETANKFASLLS